MSKDKGVYKDLSFCKAAGNACSELHKGRSVILAAAIIEAHLQAPENIKILLISGEILHNHIASYT